MSKDEFMYDHDLNTISDLLNRHAKFHGLINDEDEPKKATKQSNPREFFL